jgi:hypothetical protein
MGEAQFVSDTRGGRAANLLIFHNVVAMIKVLKGSLQKDMRSMQNS